jgi:L-lactate dehydrogenase complex protein LldG
MSKSKTAILEAIRRVRPPERPAPDLAQSWTTYPDRARQFADVLKTVGGECRTVRDLAQLNDELRGLSVVASAKKIASLVPNVGMPNVDLAAIDSPHALADIDVAILSGQFAVAENAAIWVTDDRVPLRVVYFICQHLVLVVPADQVVSNMHEAYARLAVDATFAESRFGAFISGPSKTADIEQALVIGAQGPRSLTVFLVESNHGTA